MHHSNMACDGSNEKDISVAFERLSISSSDQISSQTKNDSEYPPPVQSQILSAIQKIRKSKNRAHVKAITKKINKTSAQVLMKAALRSIYLSYQTRKLSLMLKLHNI